jgi:hypothetical protein
LLKTAQNHVFQEIIRLPLDVIPVLTNPAPSNPLNRPSDQEIRSFLAHCYGKYTSDDEPIVSEVLEKKSSEVLRAIRLRSILDIKPPHCECTLVHYLLSQQKSAPYPYIAVSKFSCLTCGLYLAACRKYGKQKGEEGRVIRFQTRGCHADVTPLVALPTGPTTAELDAFVEEDVLNAVKEIVKVVLRSSVNRERERMRRLSQSTAGSDGSSSEGPGQTIMRNGKIFLYRGAYNLIDASFSLEINERNAPSRGGLGMIVGHPFQKRALEVYPVNLDSQSSCRLLPT